MILIDTCGWIEWLTDGILADKYKPYMHDIESIIVPTSVQFEFITSDDHFLNLPNVIYFKK